MHVSSSRRLPRPMDFIEQRTYWKKRSHAALMRSSGLGVVNNEAGVRLCCFDQRIDLEMLIQAVHTVTRQIPWAAHNDWLAIFSKEVCIGRSWHTGQFRGLDACVAQRREH